MKGDSGQAEVFFPHYSAEVAEKVTEVGREAMREMMEKMDNTIIGYDKERKEVALH